MRQQRSSSCILLCVLQRVNAPMLQCSTEVTRLFPCFVALVGQNHVKNCNRQYAISVWYCISQRWNGLRTFLRRRGGFPPSVQCSLDSFRCWAPGLKNPVCGEDPENAVEVPAAAPEEWGGGFPVGKNPPLADMSLGAPVWKKRLKKSCRSAGEPPPAAWSEGDLWRLVLLLPFEPKEMWYCTRCVSGEMLIRWQPAHSVMSKTLPSMKAKYVMRSPSILDSAHRSPSSALCLLLHSAQNRASPGSRSISKRLCLPSHLVHIMVFMASFRSSCSLVRNSFMDFESSVAAIRFLQTHNPNTTKTLQTHAFVVISKKHAHVTFLILIIVIFKTISQLITFCTL